MDDLGVIELLRSNMKEAKEKATDWLNEEDIEGALLVFQVIDVTGAGKNDLSRACYNSVHTEFGYVGACAGENFIHIFLHHINSEHMRLMRDARALHCPSWPKASVAIERVVIEGDNDSTFDIIVAVWGCEHPDQNLQLATILKEV